MPVTPSEFGITGFAFPVVEEGAGICDFPSESNVRLGVSYDNGALTGNLEIPDEADVREGVGYGSNGTEFTGTLIVPVPVTPGGNLLLHSPADIFRWLLIQLGYGVAPGESPWPINHPNEPDLPDNTITVYDTSGTNYGRTNPDSEMQEYHGIQVRVRSVTPKEGFARARSIAVGMDEVISQEWVTVEGTSYFIHTVIRQGDVISLGKDKPTNRLHLYTVNALMLVQVGITPP